MMLRCVLRRGGVGVALLILFACILESVHAQYKVFTWENLNDGQFPLSLIRKHDGAEDNIYVVDLRTPDAYPGILNGIARTECGPFALTLRTEPKRRFISVINPVPLNRDQLGNVGKALYQADFYFSSNPKDDPNMAILAVNASEWGDTSEWAIYRFGIIDGERVYFAYANKTTQPSIYKQEFAQGMNLKRPGWHRFQIILRGHDEIWCAIDSKPTKFSPIKEGTFRVLQAGVMITAPPDRNMQCFIDNISIQWIPEDAPLPDSPWLLPDSYSATPRPQRTPTTSQTAQTGSQQTPQPAAQSVVWYTAHQDAWQQCQTLQKPILLLLYLPRIDTYTRLEQTFKTNKEAEQFLSNYVCLKMDANQLHAGWLAQKFEVYKVPCFLIFDVMGQEKGRAVVLKNTEWSTITEMLQKPAPPQ